MPGRSPSRSHGPTTWPGIRLLQTSSAAVPHDVETEVFDHMVRQQLAAHGLDPFACLVLAGPFEAELDVLADPDVGDLAEAERREALSDGDPLRVVDNGLGGDDDDGSHVSFLGLPGNSTLPPTPWYAVRYRRRVCATTSSGRRGGSDSLSQPERPSQSRTDCLSYESGDVPTWYVAASQKRELSGVRTSSIRVRSSPTRPNSNLVSARIKPRRAENSDAYL